MMKLLDALRESRCSGPVQKAKVKDPDGCTRLMARLSPGRDIQVQDSENGAISTIPVKFAGKLDNWNWEPINEL